MEITPYRDNKPPPYPPRAGQKLGCGLPETTNQNPSALSDFEIYVTAPAVGAGLVQVHHSVEAWGFGRQHLVRSKQTHTSKAEDW